jgi:hypothetical protein
VVVFARSEQGADQYAIKCAAVLVFPYVVSWLTAFP